LQFDETSSLSRNRYLLISELAELLLIFGAKPTMTKIPKQIDIFINAANLMAAREKRKNQSIADRDDSYHQIMDTLSDIFRYHVFNSTGSNEAVVFKKFKVDDVTFIKPFITVADYSKQPGHSKKLVQQLLRTLSITDMLKLQNALTSRVEITNNSGNDVLYKRTSDALKWVCEEYRPFSLQHLARCVITDSVHYRHIHNVETLGLATAMHQYVLFQSA